MRNMNGFNAYSSEYVLNRLPGNIDSRQYGTESQKIAEISIRYLLRKVNVKPVLKPYIYQFKKAPVPGRGNDKKGQISIENEKSFVF
jgi:hypothetical protein